ncbi:acyltransferase family protein [Paenibacillus sp. MBLB4367]|uniref:acyltransferase family protein n=1 Tax=Paenibacillus sp. MBLB4367 TaxID=3384767 RepID=UPI003907F7BB
MILEVVMFGLLKREQAGDLMSKKVIGELFVLRSTACLSLVLLHSFARVYGSDIEAINTVNLLLTFATPMFVFISEFVLAHSYPDKQPKQFWTKRLKYLLLPYLFFGTFYAFVKAVEMRNGLSYSEAALQLLWKHILLGDFHGYFILVIFQFYALHGLYTKVIRDRISPITVISVSLLIQLLYLSFFNLVKPLDIPFAAYIWDKLFWLPVFGWLSYFSIAYYCGRNYEAFKRQLIKRTKWVVMAPIVTAILPIVLYKLGVYTEISSKRFDMVPFVIAMTLFLFLMALKLRSIPNIIVQISKYSFGIYLFHPFYMAVFKAFENKIPFTISSVPLVGLYFFSSIILSVVSVYIANKIKYGTYLVGRLGLDTGTTKKQLAVPLHPSSSTDVKV